MKKLSFYITLALAGFFMGSCSDDFTDWADPQHYGQEDAVTIPGFSATAAATIDLNNAADSAQAFTLSGAQLPAGYQLGSARIELTPVKDGAKTTQVAADINGKVVATELQPIVADAFGLRPVARAVKGHVYVSAIKDGEAAFIDAGEISLNIIPKAPVIEDTYYITGSINGWDNTNVAYPLTNGGDDVYDNPVFTINIDAAKVTSDLEFKLTPKSGIGGDWSKCIAAGNEEGKFNYNNEGGNLKVTRDPEAKVYRISFNMLEQTWTAEVLKFSPFIYEIGNNTGWSSVVALSGPNGDGKYYGAIRLQSGFKFRSNVGDWNGDLNLGQDGANRKEGVLINSGGSADIQIAETGFYNVTIDVAALSYQLKKFNSIDIIGDAQPGGWSTGTVMTYNETNHTWVANNVTLKDGTIKFRSDQSWDNVNMGGTIDNLVQNSNANCPVSAGTYNIILHTENAEARAPYAELVPVK